MKEIAKAYASALFGVAEDLMKTEEYKLATEMVLEVFKENPNYKNILSSPSILLSRRIDSLDSVFGSILPKEILYFLKLMCKNRDTDKIEPLLIEFIGLCNKAKNIKTVKVTSSEALSKEQIDALTRKLEKITNSKVILELEEEKNIIGGIKVEIDEKVFDGSVKRSLELLKETVR